MSLFYRFDNHEHCQLWENSIEHSEFVAQMDGLIEGDTDVKRVTGLEFWFELPEIPAQRMVSPLRMSLVLCVVVYALVPPIY